jgi:hypothetical protein
MVRLLGRAKDEGDWELCKELARFLTALDESGETLKEALELVDLRSPQEKLGGGSFLFEGSRLKVPRARNYGSTGLGGHDSASSRSSSGSRSPTSSNRVIRPIQGDDEKGEDYFSSNSR